MYRNVDSEEELNNHPRRLLQSTPSEGMARNVTAVPYNWLVGHQNTYTHQSGRKSAYLQSSQSQSRILSAQSRLSGYRNSTPAMIYALAALASSMSRAMR